MVHGMLSRTSQVHSKLASCSMCKTLIKTGEVLHSPGEGGSMSSYCSVNCMNKGKLASASFHSEYPTHECLLQLQVKVCCQHEIPRGDVWTCFCTATEPTCHFCKRTSLPQYQATLPEGNVLNFCSSQCVTKFQVRPGRHGTVWYFLLLPTWGEGILFCGIVTLHVAVGMSFPHRMQLCKRPPMGRRPSPLQTTQSSWSVTTVEEHSAWNLKLLIGRWDNRLTSEMFAQGHHDTENRRGLEINCLSQCISCQVFFMHTEHAAHGYPSQSIHSLHYFSPTIQHGYRSLDV